MDRCKIVYYISGHGYGHAVRAIQIINELLRRGCTVCIKTTAPAFLFKEGLSLPAEVLPEGFDVGLHQVDNIHFDLEKTKEKVKKLLGSAEEQIQKEQQFWGDYGVRGIVCDIPFIPLAAADRSGLPAIGISNFSWDWIYSSYGGGDPEWNHLAQEVRRYYQTGSLLLRLPFYGAMNAFRRIEDIPLVARRSDKGQKEIRQLLGLPSGIKIGLIGFSHLSLQKEAIQRIEELSSEYLFLIKNPINWESPIFRKIEGEALSFVDLVRAADFVMTKPGYGMVSDCLSHGTPMIFSDRGGFPEYPILVKGIKSLLASCFMPKEALYSGNWGPYLGKLGRQPRKHPRLKTNGAQVAAKRIMEWVESGGG